MNGKSLVKLVGSCIFQFIGHILGALIVGLSLSCIILFYQWPEFTSTFSSEISFFTIFKLLLILSYAVMLPLALIFINYQNALKGSVSMLISGKRELCIRGLVSLVLEKNPDFSNIEGISSKLEDVRLFVCKLPFPFGSVLSKFVSHINFGHNFIEASQQVKASGNNINDRIDLISNELAKLVPTDFLKPAYTTSLILVVVAIVIAII